MWSSCGLAVAHIRAAVNSYEFYIAYEIHVRMRNAYIVYTVARPLNCIAAYITPYAN